MGSENIASGSAGAAPAARPTRAQPARLGDAVTLAALALAAALPYLNSLANGFVYDDLNQVSDNPYLRSFHYLPQIFTTSAWSYLGGSAAATNYYRPLMTTGYLVCFQLFGPGAFAFHLMNLLVNVAVVLLLYKVSARLFGGRSLALLAALAFALHPAHSESVDWIGGVTDLELTLFYLAAFWFYLRLPRISASRPRWLAVQLAVVANLALTLLAKEQALTLPILLTLYEHVYREDRGETRLAEKVARYAPAWLLVPVYLAVRAHFLGGLAPAASGRPHLSPDALLLSASALLGQYAAKFLWPVRLCLYYVFPTEWNRLLPEVLGGIAALWMGALLFLLLWHYARRVSFGLVWFLVTLAPVLNVGWMPAAAFAERYLYLPSAGLCWVIAWAGLWLWNAARSLGHARRLALAAAAVLLALLAVARIVTRNRDWKDNLDLYRRTLEVSPDAYVIHNNLGEVYWKSGQAELAAAEWRAAATLAPDAVVVLDNLGLLDTSEHHYDEAVAHLQRAIGIAPRDAAAHINLGMTYDQMGRPEDAQRESETAVRLAPLSFFAHNELGQQYFDQGRYAGADRQFRASLALKPTLSAWFGLGLSRWRQGDTAEAELDFKSAEALAPADPRAHFILGLFYAARGRYPEAVNEYQAGLEIDPANPQALAAIQKLKAEISHENSNGAAGPSSPSEPAHP
ncbi:MAG TPA: tetratricopeptide repeat protein [Terriglobia bacterium]|nr:tetratricopeptide repeat protein [Terriglobia bacterium]